MICLYLNTSAQSYFGLAARGSSIISPKVDFDGPAFGFGGSLRIDWRNAWMKDRILEIAFDKYSLIDQPDAALSASRGDTYSLTAISVTYGFIAFFSEKQSGLYANFSLGLFLSDVEGSIDKDLNNKLGITALISPRLGYSFHFIDLGVQLTAAPSIGGLFVAPLFHCGVRLNSKMSSKNE